ncbi:hypothetical protein AYO41_00945 [Verrucomicrobia bacterium SCGC AG-212-E04]|nr:hypothetical protein AYO41_00945 [Verrucomicrobia bacterium SCGC AG-212-E04]
MAKIPSRPWPGIGSLGSVVQVALVVLLLQTGCQKRSESPAAAANPTPTPVVDTAAALESARLGLATTEQELQKRYLELDKRRVRLVKASPAEVEAYNRDAATYSADRAALQRRQEAVQKLEQAELTRRQAVPTAEQSAQQTLSRLSAAITIGDWPAQVAAMEQALMQHRNTQAFARMSALARPRLAAATLPEVEKALAKSAQASSIPTRTAHAGADVLVAQLRGIINQPIQPVNKGDGSVGTYNFHPGGGPLDYERVTREELWKDRQTFPQSVIEPQSHRGTFYRTEDVEFNIRLKWYYSDPTHPTKRLSESDYDRIVDVCRRIAQAQKESPAVAPAASATPPSRPTAAQLWPRIEALQRAWPQ